MYDIHSGAFDYNTVLKRTIENMTKSGLRWIDYESGWHNRVPVAARRAVMTGFRQVQGKINEQTAEALGTDSYEVTVHIGARPTHQVWEGKIWTMTQLRTVCGLGEVTGLHGANCYHDYNPFIPGVDVPEYSQAELDQIHRQENTPKRYNGKEYTTYEALQRQRKLETKARKYREDVHLLEEGGGSEDDIIAKKCRYQGTLQEYRDFSKKMDLPMQKERIYQDGLKVDMNRLGKENSGEKYRVRSYEKAPYYTKDTAINACRTTDEIRALFPETAFLKRFEKLPFEVQKEIAQGFNYMRKSFGSKAMPLTCNTSKMDDYGKTQLRLRKIMVKDSLREDEAFSTACHENIHVFDYNNGLISEKVLPNAFKSLGIKSNSREADTQVLDLLGYKLYNKYRNDNAELMAYAFEERLYNSDNKLVNAIIQELERYLI